MRDKHKIIILFIVIIAIIGGTIFFFFNSKNENQTNSSKDKISSNVEKETPNIKSNDFNTDTKEKEEKKDTNTSRHNSDYKSDNTNITKNLNSITPHFNPIPKKNSESYNQVTENKVKPIKPDNGGVKPIKPDDAGVKPTEPSKKTIYGQAPTSYGFYVKLYAIIDEQGKILEVGDNGTKPKEDAVSPDLWNDSKILFKKLVGLNVTQIENLRTKVGGNSEEKADAISGATYTCNAIKEAILDAFGKAIVVDKFITNPKEPHVLEQYLGDDEFVIIPKNITSIDEYAFSGKEKLKRVFFHEKVEYINPKAFENCKELEDFSIDENNEEYYSKDGVIFDKKKDGELAVFPCGRKGHFNVEDDIKSIGNKAFYSSQLTSLYIPKTVISLGEGFVDYASNLEALLVDDLNPNYSSEDGIIYNKEKSEILFVPPGISGEHTIANTVKSIAEFAFYSCTKLTKINLPKNLTSISLGAFAGCGGLTDITLPTNLKEINDRAFAGCVRLSNIIIPENVEHFGEFVFTDCRNLQNILVDDLNPNFNSKKGVLFDASGKTLYAYPIGRVGDYEIPARTETIVNGAFYSAMNIGRVTVPETVTNIGQFSFALPNPDMIPRNLVIVTQEDSAAHKNALMNGLTFELVKSTSEDNNKDKKIAKGTKIKKDGLHYRATDNNTVYLTSIDDDVVNVVIPDTVEHEDVRLPVVQINTNVLSDISNAETLTVGNNVTKIMDLAFLGCTTLKTINIGKNVSSCDYSAFNDCSGLEAIHVDSENADFFSDNGVLYKKEGSNIALIRYPSSKVGAEYTILDDTNKIDQNAFERAKKLEKLIVPDSVVTIGDEDTFYRPKSYATLTIVGNDNSFIQNYYNENFSDKENIKFQNSNVNTDPNEPPVADKEIPKGTKIKKDGLHYKVADNNTVYLTSIDDDVVNVVIPDTVEHEDVRLPVVQINTNVLSDISNAETLTVGNNVTKIMDLAFLGCTTLKTINIGKNVSSCDYSAFNDCSGLEAIHVDSENADFFSDNGVLYKKEGSNIALIRYPSSKVGAEYTILDDTNKIDQNAFERAKKLEKLIVPDSVVTIGDEDTFYRPKSYATLTIVGNDNSFIQNYYNEHFTDKANIVFILN
ncbi:MAG: leucine-rich repeat protein [Eubacteriales bacterium]|nr:leucine-rich repeat protein [Eubacteriales bacterium]